MGGCRVRAGGWGPGLVTAMAFQIMTTNLKYATGVGLNTADFVSTWTDVRCLRHCPAPPISVCFYGVSFLD